MITFHVLETMGRAAIIASNDGDARVVGDFDQPAVAEIIARLLRQLDDAERADIWERAA